MHPSWNTLSNLPANEGRVLLLLESGMVISGVYVHETLIPDIINSGNPVIGWVFSHLME